MIANQYPFESSFSTSTNEPISIPLSSLLQTCKYNFTEKVSSQFSYYTLLLTWEKKSSGTSSAFLTCKYLLQSNLPSKIKTDNILYMS